MRITIVCPECGGDGADMEDSSRSCYECGGSGVVSGIASDPQQLHQADADPRLAIDPVIDEE